MTRCPWIRTFLRLGACLLLVVTLLGPQSPAAGAATTCQVDGPVSAAYSVTVCLTNPPAGETVSGTVTMTATVSVSSGGPGVQSVAILLDGAPIITDFEAPWSAVVSTGRYVDGAKLIQVTANLRDGFKSQPAGGLVTFANGITQPPVDRSTFTPASGTSPPSGQPFVLAAVGDGADGATNAGAVSNLIAGWNPNMFLYLGDVYEDGTPAEFANWYGSQGTNFGRFRAITNPTVGNHEYQGNQAPGYFDYWNNVPHSYSFNAGGWHVISIDSTSQFNQTAPGSGQYNWLQNDLNANSTPCTLVYMHHPLYNVGPEGAATRLADIWTLLADHGVDLVLAGHDHDYQRWTAMNRSGQPATGGVTQIIAGSGGHGIQQFVTTDSRMVKGIDTTGSFGALRLELNAQGAAYQSVNTQKTILDSGSVPCSAAPDTAAPAAPANLTATAMGAHRVDLAWTTPVDDVGVVGYDVYRDGQLITSAGPATSYSDNAVASEITYRYQIVARDAAGHTSPMSATTTITTPAGQTGLFVDEFESGTLGAWTFNAGLVAQQQQVFSGNWGARATSTGAATWAYKSLPAQTSLYYRIRFKLLSNPSAVNLLKFRSGTGTSILGVNVANTGKLGYRNDLTAVSTTSTTTVSSGVWHTLQAHVVVNGTSSSTETWLDDSLVPALSKAENFTGVPSADRIQLGENSTGKTYDVAFDTVIANNSFIVSDTTAPTIPASLSATVVSDSRVDLSWPASTDNVAVAGYTLYRDGVRLAGLPAQSLTYSDVTAAAGTRYTYTIDAFDGAANHSLASGPATVTTAPDATPPTVPSGLAVTGVSATQVDIGWSPSTDNVGVTGYQVWRNGILLETSESPDAVTHSFTDLNVSPSTAYQYAVTAYDANHNVSSLSAAVTVTTPSDTTPPSAPTGLSATSSSSTVVNLGWSAATDNVAVTGYSVYRNGNLLGTLPGTSLGYVDSTVAPNTAYSYTVDAFDAAGNHSAASAPAAVTTPADTMPPSAPTGLSAAAAAATLVNLSWSAATDNVAVTGYSVYRNGSPLADVAGGTLGYADSTVAPNTAYTYTVDAFDAAGNHSAASAPATVTTPVNVHFEDGFESGNLSAWTTVNGLTVQQQNVRSGVWAARAASTNGPTAYASKNLAAAQTSLYYRARFMIVSQATVVNLLKLRTTKASGDVSLAALSLGSTGNLTYRNDVAGQTTVSTIKPSAGVWHTLEIHIVVNGASGQVETWLDGARVSALTKTDNLGTTSIGRLQLGENSTGRTYDVAFDDVVADTGYIP